MRKGTIPSLILLFLFCSCHTLDLSAQSESSFKKHRSIRWYVGVQNMKINSELVSNLNYSGLAVPLRLGYKVEDSLTRHLILVDYTNFKLTNQFNERELDGPFVSSEYHYGKYIKGLSSAKSRFYLGGYIKGKTLARGLTSEQFVLAVHDTYFSIGPSLSYVKDIGEFNSFEFQLSTPLVSYLLDRSSEFTSNDAIVPFNNLVDYKFELEYTLKPNNITSFILNYNFNYYNANRDQSSAKHASHTFFVGFFVQI